MALGFLGKAASGIGKGVSKGFKNARASMTGTGGGVNTGPSQGFGARFAQGLPFALNNAAQMWGGQMSPMARMTGGMMRKPTAPSGNTGVAGPTGSPVPQGGINTAPSTMPPIRPQVTPMPGANTGFTGIGAPGAITPQPGGNTGIAGGLFNRPRLDPMSNQYTTPNSMGNTGFTGGLWDTYNRMTSIGPDESQVPGRQIYF